MMQRKTQMGITAIETIILLAGIANSIITQTNGPPKLPAPRRHFTWQRMVNDELIQEKAFAVENPFLQVIALISRDPQLGESQFVGSVSVYDFSTPRPLAAVKPFLQGQPCFLLPPPQGDFNSTLDLLESRNGGQVNTTGQWLELRASDLPLPDSRRTAIFNSNPVLLRLCGRQPVFTCYEPDPLAYDPYLATESEQLTFSVLTLEGSTTITFTWEAMTQ